MPTLEQQTIGDMFDRIAKSYDKANRVLSFGQDSRWRRRLAMELPAVPDLSILDVATGTADLLIAMMTFGKFVTRAVGIDISENMLSLAQEKITRAGLADKVALKKASASSLPFADDSFDIITMAFGIRNVTEMERALSECARVLKGSGRFLILEFSLPKARLIRWAYLCYFRYILPLLGGILSRDFAAYRYLNKSVEAFPCSEDFRKIILKNGFKHVDLTPFSLGVATLYCCRKI